MSLPLLGAGSSAPGFAGNALLWQNETDVILWQSLEADILLWG